MPEEKAAIIAAMEESLILSIVLTKNHQSLSLA